MRDPNLKERLKHKLARAAWNNSRKQLKRDDQTTAEMAYRSFVAGATWLAKELKKETKFR